MPNARPDAILIRRPGNGNTGYAYLTGTGTLSAGIDSPGGTTRPAASAYYRRVNVSIVPSETSYAITVNWQTTQGGTFTTVLGPYTMPSAPPPPLSWDLPPPPAVPPTTTRFATSRSTCPPTSR